MLKVLSAYGIGIAAALAAVTCRWLLDPWLGASFSLTTLYAAIAFTEWAAGSRPAVMVAVLGYIACSWLFIEPRGTLLLGNPADAIGLVIYALSALAIIYFGERLVSAREQAQTSRDRAEHEAAERRRAEEALLRVDRRKDEFIATVAHELRTPLGVVRQGVHVLKHVAPDGQGATACAAIERQVQRMSRLLDDLMDLHRIRRGEIEIRKAPVPVSDVVASAVEIVSPLIEERCHRLEIQAPVQPIFVLADAVRLSQALANLLTNAARYTPRGGRIVVACTGTQESVSIVVTDNGVGIDPAFLPRLFSLFTRGADAAVVSQDGLGIGLALARVLVEAHDGRIEAHSDGLGQGCAFAIRLPSHAAPDTAAASLGVAVLPTVNGAIAPPPPGEERAARSPPVAPSTEDAHGECEVASSSRPTPLPSAPPWRPTA